MNKILVAGAGSWGSALAIQLAKNNPNVTLWGHNPQHIQQLQKERQNSKLLPGITFPESLTLTSSLSDVDSETSVLLTVPSIAFSETLQKLQKTNWNQNKGLSWATKGLDPKTKMFLHEIALQQLGTQTPVAVLSGPTFAQEVAAGLPTALTVASNRTSFAQQWAQELSSDLFRCYTSSDIIGVEIAGATKNIIAIAAGISDGLGFGSNARSAIITRGLHEIIQLSTVYGAKYKTFMGLSGIGDLSLTCSDDKSRNRRMGLLLAQGLNREDATIKINQVVEGANAANIILGLANRKNIQMPITQEVVDILNGDTSPNQAATNLLKRGLISE